MHRIISVVLGMVAVAVLGMAQESKHVAVTGAEVKWGAPPPVLPKGAQFAVISGDPTKSGQFVTFKAYKSGKEGVALLESVRWPEN